MFSVKAEPVIVTTPPKVLTEAGEILVTDMIISPYHPPQNPEFPLTTTKV